MKKKLIQLLMLLVAAVSVGAFVSCKDTNEDYYNELRTQYIIIRKTPFAFLFLFAHCKVECSTLNELLMRQFPIGYLLAIEFHTLHVDGLVRLARSIDNQLLSVWHMQGCMLEQRCTYYILCSSCIERIEAKR